MTTENLLRGFFAAFFGIGITVAIWFRYGKTEPGEEKEMRLRWAPIVDPMLLPLFLLILMAVTMIVPGTRIAAEEVLGLLFGVFVQICVYDMLLLALLPLLRRFVRARTVASLWLLPNFLYVTTQSFMRRTEPKLVWYVDGTVLRIAALIWAAGFALVLLFGIVQHLTFRRKLLRGAKPVEEPEILEKWEWMQTRDLEYKKAKLKLVRSENTATPVSVGLFLRTIRVVLPEKDYSPEELGLVLRHELIHIQRCDSQTKLFLRFCTALCWFNPFLWIAMKKCAEDLELSCDELVLESVGEAYRAQYAELILHTAGDARGFTTCLSADAKALRYRLKGIVKPGRKLLGAILSGVLFFALLISSGWMALAYDTKPAAQVFEYRDLSMLPEQVSSVSVRENGSYYSYDCTDAQALLDYVKELPVWKLSGNYAESRYEGRDLFVLFHTPDGTVSLDLNDQSVDIGMPLKKAMRYSEVYYLQQPPDWDYVMSLLERHVEKVWSLPCEMGLNFGETVTPDGEFIDCAPYILSHSRKGEPQVLPEPPEDGVGRLDGCDVQQVQLIFYARTPESYEITVEGLNGEAPYQDALNEDFMLKLSPYSARYTVMCWFTSGEETYDIEYVFEIFLPEE